MQQSVEQRDEQVPSEPKKSEVKVEQELGAALGVEEVDDAPGLAMEQDIEDVPNRAAP
jgi:hypothetical protein